MYVNSRAIIEQETDEGSMILIQVRNKPYEGGKWLELPGGRVAVPTNGQIHVHGFSQVVFQPLFLRRLDVAFRPRGCDFHAHLLLLWNVGNSIYAFVL